MKTVFSNSMCAHVWAQQSQEHGRSQSMSFQGPVLYSYRTPIARIYETPAGRVALITNGSYSMATSSKHMPEARRAIGYACYSVPHIGAAGGMERSPYSAPCAEMHRDNLAHLAERYAERRGTLLRMRSYSSTDVADIMATLSEVAGTANRYADAFGLTRPEFTVDADARAISEARIQRESSPAAVARRAKREREEAERKERERVARAARLVELAETVAQWRAGADVNLPRDARTDEIDGAFLRYLEARGIVQTSLGAEVPADDARRALQAIGETVERMKATSDPRTVEIRRGAIRVGHFQVDAIHPDGSVRAGCHFIRASELDCMRAALGVL